MTRMHYGIVAGMAGAALAAWFGFRRRGTIAEQMAAGSPRGETIYSNTPSPF